MSNQKLSNEDVLHVAQLAKLKIADQDVEQNKNQLEEILQIIDVLNEVDTDNVDPTFSISQNINNFREDSPQDWHQKQALLVNAPATKDDMIQVPSILDGDE